MTPTVVRVFVAHKRGKRSCLPTGAFRVAQTQLLINGNTSFMYNSAKVPGGEKHKMHTKHAYVQRTVFSDFTFLLSCWLALIVEVTKTPRELFLAAYKFWRAGHPRCPNHERVYILLAIVFV